MREILTMIGSLRGKLLEKNAPEVLIEVNGVGYELAMPMSSFYDLPAVGGEVFVYTCFVVREDAQLLFGIGVGARGVEVVDALVIRLSDERHGVVHAQPLDGQRAEGCLGDGEAGLAQRDLSHE